MLNVKSFLFIYSLIINSNLMFTNEHKHTHSYKKIHTKFYFILSVVVPTNNIISGERRSFLPFFVSPVTVGCERELFTEEFIWRVSVQKRVEQVTTV